MRRENCRCVLEPSLDCKDVVKHYQSEIERLEKELHDKDVMVGTLMFILGVRK